MVSFINIIIQDGYIIADVINELNNIQERIKAKLDGSYHSSTDGDIIKATWSLVLDYEKKGTLPEHCSVAWT